MWSLHLPPKDCVIEIIVVDMSLDEAMCSAINDAVPRFPFRRRPQCNNTTEMERVRLSLVNVICQFNVEMWDVLASSDMYDHSLSQYYHVQWVVLCTSSLSSDRYCLLIPSILQDSLTTVVLSVSSWVSAYHTWLTAASVTGFELSSLITFVLKDVDPPISNPCNSLLTVEHIVLISCVDYVIICHNCIICYCTVSLGLRRWLWYDMIFYTPSNLKRSVP